MPHLETGGTQRQLREVLLNLDRDRFEPRVVGFTGFNNDYQAQLEATGTPVDVLSKERGFNPIFLWQFTRYLRKTRPTIIHAMQSSGNRYGVIAAVLARVPFRITMELYFFDWERNSFIWDPLDRLIGRWTDRIIANSNFVRDRYHRATGVPLDKFKVIYNGYDIKKYARVSLRDEGWKAKRRELGLKDGRTAIGIVARLVKVKNHAMLLRAAAKLLAQGLAFQVLIVGDGALRGELEEMNRKLGLEEHISFLGTRTDAAEIMGALDLTTLTSETESLSNSIIESLLTGRPVVATAVGGNPELIEDGKNGFLVPHDDADSLADRLRRFIAEPSLTEKMGRQAQEDATHKFGTDVSMGKLNRLYLEVLGQD